MTQPQAGLPIDPLSLIPADLAANIQKFFGGPTAPNGAVAAPACTQQGKISRSAARSPSTRTSTRRPGRWRGRRRRLGAPPRRWRTTPLRRGWSYLDEVGDATDDLAEALAALGEAFEALDDYNGERLEEQLFFRPVQMAYGRARRTHSEFAGRHGLPNRSFAPAPPGHPSQGVKGFINAPRWRPSAARTPASHSYRTRCAPSRSAMASCAQASEVRRLIAEVPRRASELVRGLGR